MRNSIPNDVPAKYSSLAITNFSFPEAFSTISISILDLYGDLEKFWFTQKKASFSSENISNYHVETFVGALRLDSGGALKTDHLADIYRLLKDSKYSFLGL